MEEGLEQKLESNDKPKEACGVLGIIGSERAPDEVVDALSFLQHRGQISAGLAYEDENLDDQLRSYKGEGLVKEVFQSYEGKEGNVAIGHTRYATSGSDPSRDAQPILIRRPPFASCHNGQINNAKSIKRELTQRGVGFEGDCDIEPPLVLQSEYLNNRLDHVADLEEDGVVRDSVEHFMNRVKGAYSVVEMFSDKLIAFRDPKGVKPLVYGSKNENGTRAYGVASESLPLTQLGFDRESISSVKPGEFISIEINEGELDFNREQIFENSQSSYCSFEYAYFAHPLSKFNDRIVEQVREGVGKKVAQKFLEKDYDVDLVAPVPETARTAASKIAKELDVRYKEDLMKNRWYDGGRTFIKEKSDRRRYALEKKYLLNVWEDARSIAIVDDSIVRGSTMSKLMEGAKEIFDISEIHIMSTFPPICHPCFYGIDMQRQDEFLAAGRTEEGIAEFFRGKNPAVESVTYNTPEDFAEATGYSLNQLCMACCTGDYPSGLTEERRNALGCKRDKELENL